jgi:ELWxxDGT repeat protein
LLDSDNSAGLTTIDGIVYFVGTTAATGSELSAYNPATGEVNVIGDVFAGPVSSFPDNLTMLNGKLYFTARDLGVPQRDIYVYDPATSEEPLPSNLFPDDFIEGDTLPRNLIAFENKIFFTADELGVGNELMVFNPETGVFTVASDINSGPDGSDPGTITEVLGKLYFSADDGINGRELWAYDPLTEKSTMVTDLSTSANGSDPGKLFVIDDKIYYNTRSGGQTRVYNPQTGERPALLEYTVNGETTNGVITDSANGRLILKFDDDTRGADTNPGAEGSRSANFVASNNEIYFSAEASFGNFEIWIYNEASGQARRFNEVTGSSLEFPNDLVVLDNRLYFVAGPVSGPRARRQWVYDPSCD